MTKNRSVKRVIGGFAVLDGDGNQIGEIFSGEGAKRKAEAAAGTENVSSIESEEDEKTVFARGNSRGGRG